MNEELIKNIAECADRSGSLKNLQEKISRSDYLRHSWFEEWSASARLESAVGLIAWLKMLIFERLAWRALRTVKTILAHKEAVRSHLNERVMLSVLHAQSGFFDTVEVNPLTKRQREACASDEDATLVIAGAGTGKTSTILAKIGLLLRTGQCQPEQILAISFTNKSANELAERVKKRLGVDIQISTFHKLGLEILSSTSGSKPLLAPFAAEPIEKSKHLGRIIDGLKNERPFSEHLVEFCVYYRIETKQLWNFSSLADYMNWLRSNRITSLDGVPKKSYQECAIANWLILNGIAFVYEQPYEHDTRTLERRQYCPDFWIPSAKIYIEHFGVDKDGNTASYIDKNEYQRGMAWKRDTHRQFQTRLVETYSWEYENGDLFPKLSEALRKAGCSFAPISPNEALQMMNKSGVIDQFSELIGTFLTLYKGNGNRLLNRKVVDSFFGNRREKLFLNLFESIFAEYHKQNQANSQIDFEDMIAQAAKEVAMDHFKSPYRYILIDEFQDISPGRAELVNAIRRNSEQCALFAVGDDWQSIYRFTGSDIGGMTRFQDLFGPTRQVNLDTTFRFDDMAAETSSKFVLKNKIQIPKQLNAVRKSTEPSLIVYRRKADEPPLDWALSTIADLSRPKSTVLVLERYKFHLPQKEEWERLKMKFPSLQLQSMSIHAAKGLEADYVVMGLRGGAWGFPSQVVDDQLFDMVLTQSDAYPNGEERRLFYVAITRAKQKTILVTETGVDMSVFASELLTDREYTIQTIGEETSKLVCKKCGSGMMLLRDGSNGKFYGCSNYPLCTNTEQTCPKCRKGLLIAKSEKSFECHVCGHQAKTCPKCKSGVLQQQKGPYGSFWGCSNFKDPDIKCRHTEKASKVDRQESSLMQ